jgi:hypothetical protein
MDSDRPDSSENPPVPPRPHAPSAPVPAPTSPDGRRAWWFVLAAVVSLLVLNLLIKGSTASGTAVDVIRGVLVIVFAGGGAAALVSAIRAIRQGDRGLLVWVAGAIGLAIVLLMVAEFTVME